jgi:peroxiredoxin
VTFKARPDDQWRDITTDELFKGKTVVVFALPGAYTPTCSSAHLPRYNELAPAFARTASTRSSASPSTMPSSCTSGRQGRKRTTSP